MDLETNLKSAIETAVKNAFDLDDVKDLIMIEIPRDNSFGDYSTNIAMRLAKTLHQNPKVIAEKVKESGMQSPAVIVIGETAEMEL